jgi:hypothetical protein
MNIILLVLLMAADFHPLTARLTYAVLAAAVPAAVARGAAEEAGADSERH